MRENWGNMRWAWQRGVLFILDACGIDFEVTADTIIKIKLDNGHLFYSYDTLEGKENLKHFILTFHGFPSLIADNDKFIKASNIFDSYLDTDDFNVALGPNSKQWWIYSSRFDAWIDPPTEVLDEMEKIRWADGDETAESLDKAEEYLLDVIKTSPDWLYDVAHWYDAEQFEI